MSRHIWKRDAKEGVCEVRTVFRWGQTEAMWSSSRRVLGQRGQNRCE